MIVDAQYGVLEALLADTHAADQAGKPMRTELLARPSQGDAAQAQPEPDESAEASSSAPAGPSSGGPAVSGAALTFTGQMPNDDDQVSNSNTTELRSTRLLARDTASLCKISHPIRRYCHCASCLSSISANLTLICNVAANKTRSCSKHGGLWLLLQSKLLHAWVHATSLRCGLTWVSRPDTLPETR